MSVIQISHRAEQELGPSVVDGKLLWSSSSGLTKADPQSTGGCLRRWWFETVMGNRQPSTAAQEKGTKLHAEIEDHLVYGKPLLTQLAIAGRHYIDERGPGLSIEHPLAIGKDGKLVAAWLHAGPVPIAGHVDLYNHRGTWITSDGEVEREPRPHTLGVKDWKTTSDFVWTKSPADLAKNIQLVTYAEAGFRMWPEYEHARVIHVYFKTRDRPDAKIVNALCDREQIGRRWEYAEGLARTIADAARETNPDKVDANRGACSAYQGCPHAGYCSVGKHDSLAQILGPRGAENAIARFNESRKDSQVSLIDKMKPAAAATPIGQTMSPAAGVGVQLSVQPAIDVEVARLQAEETARRAQAAAGIPPGFAEAFASIEASGRGMPVFVGRAAQAVADLKGFTLAAGDGIQGSGWLLDMVKQPVEDPALILQLAAEIKSLPPIVAQVNAPPPAPLVIVLPPAPAPLVVSPSALSTMVAAVMGPPVAVSVLPPDAPASNPALAAQPVEGLDNSKTRELAGLTAPAPAIAPMPAATAQPSLLGAPAPVAAAAPTPVAETAAAEPAKRKPGRPSGPRKKVTTTTKTQVGDVSHTETRTAELEDNTSIDLYVNAIPSFGFDRLEPYIDRVNAALSAEYSTADVRCAPKEGPLGYDKWKGAVAAFVKMNPPPPGAYVVKSSGTNDLNGIVAYALRDKVEESGGSFVEGWF